MILGSDYKRAGLLYGFSAISILFDVYRKSEGHILPDRPVITFFDFSTADNRRRRRADIMNELCARLPNAIRVFSKNTLMDGISILEREYERRTGDEENHYVIFAGLNRARRLLDNDRAYKMPPKSMFANLVKEGPEHGVNYIVWANEPKTFCSMFSDILPEFDNRIVYDLKEEEYELVIRSSSLKTEFENNVIAYNLDDDIKKVRIYSMPLTEWLIGFMDRIETVPEISYEDTGYDDVSSEDAYSEESYENEDDVFDENWDD